MKATIKITKGASGWWLTPEGWQENDRSPLDLESESADELRRVIIKRSFNLYRWGGEEGPHGPVSVGFHSLLVSFLAGRLAMARGLPRRTVECCKSFAAIHDGGERAGGIGDVISPILRAYPGAKKANDDCQDAAWSLFNTWLPTIAARPVGPITQIVKDADHLGAALERRYLFDDDSGDCESSDACLLFEECGISDAHAWASAADLLNVELACGDARFDAADDAAYYASELEKAIKCEL